MNKDGYTDGDTVRSNVVRIYKGIDTIDYFASISASLSNSRAELARKLNKPEGGSYVLDADIPSRIADKINNDTALQKLIKGDKGDKGDQGAKGDKGDTPKLTLDEQFRLYADGNLVSSQTLKGDRGEEGPRGATGAKGDKGDQGDKGEQGASGKNVGRNLLLNSGAPRFQDGRYTEYKLAYPIDKEGAYFLKFDVAFDEQQIYLPYGHKMKVIFGYQTALETTGYIDCYESLHDGFSRLRLNVTKNSTYKRSAESIYIYPNEDYENPDKDPHCGKFTIKNVQLEYGSMPKVWTPAPEDLLAELDKYTTLTQYNKNREEDSRKLDSKLDKPTSGKYILDKDIPSEFEKLVKVGGRNLIVTKRWKAGYLYGDRDENAYPVGSENYKVLVGYGSFRFDPVYIPTLGESKVTYKLYDNGGSTNGTVQIHAYDKDKKFLWWDFDGWRGEIGRTRTYTLPTDTRYIRLGVTNKDVRAKVEFGNVATDWTPAPEDIQSEIKDLKKNELTPIEKEWVGKMGSILFPNMEDSPQNKGGLSIDRSMFLRFSDGKPSALIGGNIGKGAVLMAGVQNYGTDNLSARTEIYQDGSAKFGDVNLSDKTITLMPKSGLPLRVTAEEGSFIENFLANSKDDRYIAYEKSFVVVGKGEVQTYSFDVANNDTKLTITIPTLTSEVYQINQSVTLTLDGVTLGSWRGDSKLVKEDSSGIVGGGVRFRKENTPLVVENLKFERYLNSGSHTLSVSVTSTDTTDKATITKLTAHLYYDASQAETILTCNGFRAFGGQNRYFDIDRSATYLAKGYFTRSNPYIARVKGGMRVDSLTLEQPLDAPGCVLAGGRVENGYVRASFGKYKNKRNESVPRAIFDNSDKIYAVFHSIGNTNYTPIVTSCAGQWGDVPQVIGVYAYRFDVRFINFNNEPSVGWNFNYVCYKGD